MSLAQPSVIPWRMRPRPITPIGAFPHRTLRLDWWRMEYDLAAEGGRNIMGSTGVSKDGAMVGLVEASSGNGVDCDTIAFRNLMGNLPLRRKRYGSRRSP